ncbi:MAG: glycosyltransferase family 39 protein [Flavobacteriales bacterium]|nr:glycosyltransferase family 39 protein [Flavobacteriales bacterium]
MKQPHLFWILFALLAVSLFVNMGVNPLFLEEPRRAMVALEMYLQNNLLTPTLYGEFYYRKPPVFNWVILGSLKAFPNNPEFACRLVSVISILFMGLLTYWFCKKYHSDNLAQMASLLFLASVHFLFYASLFAEIDLFYSLLTYASILALFVFHRKHNKLLYFFVMYVLSAIGLLTKGAPSLVFLGLCLLAHLTLTKNLKWLISWQHLLSIAAFSSIIGAFVVAYSELNPVQNLIAAVWKQSSDQTVANHGIGKTLLRGLIYPFEVIRDLLPVSLFVPFLFIRRFRQGIGQHSMLKFVVVLLLANIMVYWGSPGTRSRYVYMLYPLAVILFTWLFIEVRKEYAWIEKALRALNSLIIALLIAAMLALPFIEDRLGIGNVSVLLISGSVIILLLLAHMVFKRKTMTQMWWLIALLIFARFQFDLIVLPARAEQGEHMEYKIHGEKISQLTRGKQLWLYRYPVGKDEASLKFGHGFYIEWNRQDVLRSIQDKNCEDFFLTQDFEVRNDSYDPVYEFYRREDRWLLIKFTGCND